MSEALDLLTPDWPAPARVRALSTTRAGGISVAPYSGLNLGDHVGDDPLAVAENRRRLSAGLPKAPAWLRQVHGVAVVDAARVAGMSGACEADAAFSRQAGAVCVVMTADCLPVLFCDRAGTVVAAAHAGWRGLAAGVLEATVAAMAVPPAELLAWLGPAIGPQAFEVGGEVRDTFLARDAAAADAFVPAAGGKWLADLFLLARQRLAGIGVGAVYGGGVCTVSDSRHFYSHRRDRITGRMATLVWLAAEDTDASRPAGA